MPSVPVRICLVVDHPQRDLEGLTLVGTQLCRRGAEVFLVPMYQLNEVFLLRPDFVLVNYVRPANRFFVRACNALGIGVGVLDTEGGILQNVGRFADEICANVRGLRLHLYCTWGNRQHQALSARSCLVDGKVVPTGCPRYDYAVLPWREAIEDLPLAGSVVLVNTNFPFINPRFQPHARELEEQKKLGRFTDRELAELIAQSHYAQREVIETVITVAGRMPDTTFVVRPHPFESERVYQEAFAGARNVKVMQDKSVFPWIRKARAVVHHNCSTAIESFMMDRVPIHLAWIRAPRLEQQSSVAVSLKADSVVHLEALLRDICTDRCPPVPTDVVASRARVVHDWFYANDGMAAARVAEAILQTVARVAPQRRPIDRLAYLARVLTAPIGLRRWLQLLLLLTMGKRFYELARCFGGRGDVPQTKRFDRRGVGEISERIRSAVPEGWRITVEQGRCDHAYLRPFRISESVRMTATAATSAQEALLDHSSRAARHGDIRLREHTDVQT